MNSWPPVGFCGWPYGKDRFELADFARVCRHAVDSQQHLILLGNERLCRGIENRKPKLGRLGNLRTTQSITRGSALFTAFATCSHTLHWNTTISSMMWCNGNINSIFSSTSELPLRSHLLFWLSRGMIEKLASTFRRSCSWC